jgi:adenine phosphoribosyltransferase
MKKANPRQFLKDTIRSIPDYPKQGIIFRDLSTVFQDKEAFAIALELLEDRIRGENARSIPFDKIAGIEARGFILAGALAARLGGGVVMLRKPGKLPFRKRRVEYTLEYGKDAMEIHEDAINRGERIILIDDLLATGGTAAAACKLIEEGGGKIVKILFLVELPDLGGREKLKPYDTETIIGFEGH